MAQFKNNDFGHDNDAAHTLRVEFCLSGIAEHEGELDFPGTLVDDLTEHIEAWKHLLVEVPDESGDQAGATALVMSLLKDLRALVVSTRFMVQSVAGGAESEEDAGVIFADYGVVGNTPARRFELLALAKKMVEANARYVEQGNPFALPEERFEAISAKIAEVEDAIKRQNKEKSERHHAIVAKRLERKKGDKLLSGIFNWLRALWGVDDYRLELFGFVPKSQIWTKKRPPKGNHE